MATSLSRTVVHVDNLIDLVAQAHVDGRAYFIGMDFGTDLGPFASEPMGFLAPEAARTRARRRRSELLVASRLAQVQYGR